MNDFLIIMYKLGNNILHLDNKPIYGSGVPILTEMTLFHMTFENTLTPVVNNTVDDITFTNYGLTTLSYQSSYKCEGTYSYRGRAWEIGDYWQWLVNTTGFKDLTFSFGSLVSSTNELSDKLDVRVSPDGTNWTTVIASLIYDNAFICNYNLSDVFPASCNNNTTTYIRIYMYSVL